MKSCTVAFTSITHASKAKFILEQYGLKVKMIRTPRNMASGCGYSIVAEAEPQFIASVLEGYGLNYRSISEAG